MEFPSFNNNNHYHHHHHNRYIPPPPPPLNNFSDDHPNLYPHHHHHLMPPLHLPPPPPLSYPSLPPPPPPAIHVPPPPPSYNPHQSHFTFLDPQNTSFLNHGRSPPRFSNQSHRFDYRTDSWSDPHRVPTELPHGNPIIPDDNHRRLYSPNPQSEIFYKPYGSERVIPSSRYRDDAIIDGYAGRDISNIVSQEQQVFRGSANNDDHHGRYSSARSVIDMDKSVGSSSRNLEDFVEKYEPRYMTMPENERIWDCGDEDPKWVMKGKKNEFGHDDGASFVSGREQPRDHEYESGKLNRVREGREEFKQVQKKSVLLRIGKPNNTFKNRIHDQHFSKAYLVESSNSNFRGKDKDRDHTGKDSSLNLDQRMEGDRELSPVELDVSFKSNALVAKAVVTPSSPVFDNNNTQPRNRKIKRATEFGSPLTKFSERSTRSRSSSYGLDCPSSSEKAPKQIRDKDFVYQGGGREGCDEPVSFRLKKKRKFKNFGSHASIFQLTEKDDKSVKGEKVKSSPSVSIRRAISFPPLEELNATKVDESPQAMVLEKDGSQVENPSLHDINSFGDDPAENKTLTARKVSKLDDVLVNDLSLPSSQNEVPLNLEDDTQKVSTDVEVALDGTDISASSGQDQNEVQICLTESYDNFDMNTSDPCSDENITVFPKIGDVQGLLDDVSRKEQETQLLEGTPNADGTSKFPEDGPIESPNAVVVAEDNAILTSGSELRLDLTSLGEKYDNDKVADAVLDIGATPSSSPKDISFDKDEVTEMVKLISASIETLRPDHREPSTDETYMLLKDDLPPSSSILSACADDTGAFDDQTLSNSSVPKNDDNICEKSLSKDDTSLICPEPFVENSRTSIKASHSEVTGLLANTKTASSASQGSSVKTKGLNTKMQGSNLPMKKPNSTSAVPRVFAVRSPSVFTNSRINNLPNNIAKPRTWHRSASNPVLPPKQIGTGQTSYIRSGNSLVRKGAPVTAASRSSVYQLNPSGPIETTNSAGSGSKMHSRTGGSSAPVVRPKTPPLSGSTKLPDCTTIYSRDLPSSPLEHLPMKGDCEEVASPVEGNFSVQKVSEYHKLSGVSEDQNGTSSNSEGQKTLDEGTIGKKIQYVKRKSNQLVAASCNDQSIQDIDKTQASSDGYYKRRKNQLIRTSVGNDAVNTDVRKALKINIKRQSGKGISKKYKHLRFPSVWTLSSQSLGKDGASLRQKLRPHLFPWKRSKYWGNAMNISASSNSSSSSISRKLLLSRKRETIYTRSSHGFSLRMSKLLSVGGSSLKWSKSIEKNSKRANEEATLAVAAAEKNRREQHGTAEIKRDRIFRIGSVRYKMDPSRRTLQRILDEEPSTSRKSKEVTRRSYVPKRLLIGHDEYVRIGNGNQLVRNPKRRTRIFANEKVRWSLHTARSRLAKKKKYCQFFTRFGKCNKDDGKCPYIHDSSKIAVCTKFLNGSCSNPDCKLTHKVIPERMQDCSYFMQGLCSNKHCPYRHVNVNSAASVCEGFLKGYCADGNECRKKHTYACPVFEATGACSQGTKCKLHHSKNRNMGLKRKQENSMEQQPKNTRGGRYFGSIRGGETMHISEKQHSLKDILCEEGKFVEYISLDFSNNEEASGDAATDQGTTMNSETLDLDQLTKPAGLINAIVFDTPIVS